MKRSLAGASIEPPAPIPLILRRWHAQVNTCEREFELERIRRDLANEFLQRVSEKLRRSDEGPHISNAMGSLKPLLEPATVKFRHDVLAAHSYVRGSGEVALYVCEGLFDLIFFAQGENWPEASLAKHLKATVKLGKDATLVVADIKTLPAAAVQNFLRRLKEAVQTPDPVERIYDILRDQVETECTLLPWNEVTRRIRHQFADHRDQCRRTIIRYLDRYFDFSQPASTPAGAKARKAKR